MVTSEAMWTSHVTHRVWMLSFFTMRVGGGAGANLYRTGHWSTFGREDVLHMSFKRILVGTFRIESLIFDSKKIT